MKKQRVYAIKTKSFDENGHLVCEGIVGICTSLKKALAAMDSKREFAKSCNAIFDEVDWPGYQFMYHYGEQPCAYYLYELWWYELNDESSTKYDRVLPKINY